ncbi:TolC family protein [Saccharicrinis fermentans]|uniref:Cation efflux system protein CusC n=1 Tax=Saccharicrinis fermentans DSM 9555 = JCM 21142 TaxID=869213 RepID=W7YIK4_9BACT|nr:TolC family protein [Saccharicrinis fermentans]GAF04296.1 cation efflux system protein CusC precursor [Saccharicrinis fermentans DSM 9555 = JCM 21142]
MKKLIIFFTGIVLLSSCSVYKTFETPEVEKENLYRDTSAVDAAIPEDSVNLGNLPWRELFTDPQLQELLKQGLEANVDLQTAWLRIEQAEASLSSARLAYTPDLSFSSTGTLSDFDGSTTKFHNSGLSTSWQIPLFGGLRNAKKGAEATLEQSQAYQQAVQTQLIATIANSYYYLLMLDRQLDITGKTILSWEDRIESMRALKEVGMTNEASITQSEASYYALKTTYSDLQQSIRETENALSITLGQAPQAIKRGEWQSIKLPERISAGVPLQILANRPDVKQYEMALATAFYNTNVARSAFYPNITISASSVWTNSNGGIISNPGDLLSSTIGSLTAPILNRGVNKANLKITKSLQEEALLNFKQSLLNAGSEVSNALFQYATTLQKQANRNKQLEALERSVVYTRQLFQTGASTYLEVLTAQEDLLDAQLSETNDWYDQVQAVISLYQALGGGSE